MKIIVGLGNPGRKYDGTRHNVGWWALDHLADVWRFAPWRSEGDALVADGVVGTERVRLLKPQISADTLAGDRIESISCRAPGNGEPIGGIKVGTASGWFAARPSGTESIYKIYGESFTGAAHLQRILQEAQAIVDAALSPASGPTLPMIRRGSDG